MHALVGAGWINFTGFSGDNDNSGTTGLGFTYTLWAEYTYTTEVVSGFFGVAGSVSYITALNFTIYASTNTNSSASQVTFTESNAATATAATVNDGGTAQAIGSGALLPGGGIGGAELNAQGGTGFNSSTTFELTALGSTFFTTPSPFYNTTFNNFNNTLLGVAVNGNLISVNTANGGVALNNVTQVPEPATLALLGIGLLGLGFVKRVQRRD